MEKTTMKDSQPGRAAAWLAAGRRVHLVGAGGVSMSSLCQVLHRRGVCVSGSDRQDSAALENLRGLGIPVASFESAAHVENAEAVVRTAAAGEDNPEIAAARRLGIPVLERAEAWGFLMSEYRQAICVAGTHGKTTTTGMLTHIALAAEADPTVMLGGHLPALGSGHRTGAGGLMIAEACEYHNSYHHFAPTTAVLTNIEADHLDFFRDLGEIVASFRHFCGLVPAVGHIIANREDENVRRAVEGLSGVTWFGAGGDVRAENIAQQQGRYRFDLWRGGERLGQATLRVPGLYNVHNALAAAAAALVNGMSGEAVLAGLEAFGGTGRRMERLGAYRGAEVYDDYAHHPTEVAAALRAAAGMGFSRVVCAFQPHTYTRTKALLEDFAHALRLCGKTIITDIYAAREDDPGDIHARDLCARIPGSRYCASLEETAQALREEAGEGAMLLTMGAGDVRRAAEMVAG